MEVGAECGETHCQPDSTSKRNLVLQAATVFFQRGPSRVSPAWRTNEASDPSVPSPKSKQTHNASTHGRQEKKTYFRRAQEAAKWVFTWPQEDEASDLQESFLGPAPEVLENWRVALPLVSGPTSGRRTENLSSGRVQGQAGGGGRSRLRTAWPTQGGTPPKRLRSVFGDNNNMEKLKTTTLIELTHNF